MRQYLGIVPWIMGVLLSLPVVAAEAQPVSRDVAGARDYPGLPRFRGFAIIGY
jgi:hypothetical protein